MITTLLVDAGRWLPASLFVLSLYFTRKMSLEYSEAWSSQDKRLKFHGLHATAFSIDGKWLACCSLECVYILSAASGDVATRIWYSKKAAAIAWMKDEPAMLTCGYQDGALVSLCFTGEVSCLRTPPSYGRSEEI